MEEREYRIKKLADLRTHGSDPYPALVERTHSAQECVVSFDRLSAEHTSVRVVGRVKMIRKHGGSLFLTVTDATSPLQYYIKKDAVSDEDFTVANEFLDIGDFVQASGILFRTRLGEKTLHVESIRIISKSIQGLPEKWHGLSDIETRYRKRYLDLIANPEVADRFRKRNIIINEIRNFFCENEFLEVETPILQPIAGGATARPFVTRHNALDQDMYLRVAPELYLKRLIIGGFERVFEIGRCFRNEGIDYAHNPEFTMVEAYMAYADYTTLMHLIEQLCARVSKAVSSNLFISSKPFNRLPYFDALCEHAGLPMHTLIDENQLQHECKKRGLKDEALLSYPSMLDELTKKFVLPKLVDPTFLIDHPVAISPLSKRKSSNPDLAERFQLIVEGKEIVNAFSELNDPLDQRERFMQQEIHRSQGDDQAHKTDEDFIIALEHGLPPTAGLGIGIDRLVALLVGVHSLKEVILFPTLKSE